MKKAIRLILAVMFVVGMTQMASAGGEHGGKEHGGNEHGGKEQKGSHIQKSEPSKDDIRNAMKTFVKQKAEANGGTFLIKDVDTKKVRKLEMVRVHERVGKTGPYYYSCADFKDLDSGEMLDLDIDVENHHGMLMVKDVRIHKLEGEPRYTYDDDDNRIPLKEGTKSHLGAKGSGKAQMKGSGNEHGGKEHGGHDHKKEHGGKEHGGH